MQQHRIAPELVLQVDNPFSMAVRTTQRTAQRHEAEFHVVEPESTAKKQPECRRFMWKSATFHTYVVEVVAECDFYLAYSTGPTRLERAPRWTDRGALRAWAPQFLGVPRRLHRLATEVVVYAQL